MPEWRCPAGDYTASKPSEAETAVDLSQHLLKSHCKTDVGYIMEPEQYDQVKALLNDVAIRARADASVGSVDLKADIDARAR